MIKTFIFGLILGLAGAAAAVYFVPAVNLHREASLISVQPNGGNSEAFHINLPQDRILAGARSGSQSSAFPEGLMWPEEKSLEGSETEIFKLRNKANVVIGMAARISSFSDSSGSFIQWMIHLPARGTMFARMELGTTENGQRNGLLMTGTREFSTLNGGIREFFNSAAADPELDISGRLELVTALVGPLGEAP